MELDDAVEILGDVARGAWNSRQDEAARVVLGALDYAPGIEHDKLREIAKGIDEAIAHHHEYDELDEEWLVETARRLREMAG